MYMLTEGSKATGTILPSHECWEWESTNAFKPPSSLLTIMGTLRARGLAQQKSQPRFDAQHCKTNHRNKGTLPLKVAPSGQQLSTMSESVLGGHW